MYHVHLTEVSYVSAIAVYAPTNPSSNTVKAVAPSDAFYDQLQSVVAAVPTRDMLLVLEDFNARVGMGFQCWKSLVHMVWVNATAMVKGC